MAFHTLVFLSSLHLSWVVCESLVLEKEGSPVSSFHLKVFLVSMFDLLTALTVSPTDSQGCQKWHDSSEQLGWFGKKNEIPGVFLP